MLDELVHEDGHAVHYAALRTRPAFFSLGDDLFCEAFADVPAWSTAEPQWQQKYLGRRAAEGTALRELFSTVMLDVAWSLFELRMIEHPATDPNQLWTGNYFALPEYRSACGVVMVGVARPVGALAGIHDQLWLGRRPHRGHTRSASAMPSVNSIPAIPAGTPGPRSTCCDTAPPSKRRNCCTVSWAGRSRRMPSCGNCSGSVQWKCSLANTSVKLRSSNSIASSTSASSITSGGMKRTVL